MNDRIESLDVLRGIAVLGLPTMNMVNFAMPPAAYLNPTIFDNSSYLNHVVYSLFHIFSDQKFMGLFSLLFGASIILLAEKRKVRAQSTITGHYARMFWLLVLGIIHYWFLWEGDILSLYALIAIIAFPMYKGSTKFLSIITTISFALCLFLSSNSYVTSMALGAVGKAEILKEYAPTEEQMATLEVNRLDPSYTENMRPNRDPFIKNWNSKSAQEFAETESNPVVDQYFYSIILKVFGLMSLGMLLYRTGFLSGQRSHTEYLLMAQFGLIIGMSFTFAALLWNYSNNFNVQAFFEYGMLLSTVGSIAMTIGYVGLFTLAFKTGFFGKMTEYISSVGKMALSNYLMQSFICAFIFYGFGLGLYGSLTRFGLVPIILLLWVFQLYASKCWLKHFTQGPIEWVWRTLSTFSVQTIRRKSES